MTATLVRSESDELLTAPMPQRPLGHTGWNASVLTLGGVKWDTQCTDDEAAELIHRAMELGVNTFDTAHIYGDGESERKLGLALEGRRDKIWLNTKVIDRTYDGAMRQMETSLKRLRTDRVDLMFVHSLDSEEHRQQILAPNSVLKAVEEMKAARHIRHIGISGHWVKDVMAQILTEYDFEAVLFPIGLFNHAYDYRFVDTVLPVARQRNMAVFGMKVFGAGRVKHAASIEPYLRHALHVPVDSMIIGSDSIRQLEGKVRIIKSGPPALTDAERAALVPEAIAITQEWDMEEFNWVSGYEQPD
jgi:aryl-alcohol dehydrogenase-like predicted oxidoreductase